MPVFTAIDNVSGNVGRCAVPAVHSSIYPHSRVRRVMFPVPLLQRLTRGHSLTATSSSWVVWLCLPPGPLLVLLVAKSSRS